MVSYLLNIKLQYEKDVIFQTSLPRHVNPAPASYDEKVFHLNDHKIDMKKKALRHANVKTFACHLISMKITVM